VSARVELFSWLMATSYLAFVRPELRERRFEFDPRSARGRALARALPWLDWFARFEIRERAQPATENAIYVTNRAGHTANGWRGLGLLAEAVPALFPIWAPLALLAWLSPAPKQA